MEDRLAQFGALEQLQSAGEIPAACDELAASFARAPEPGLRESVARELVNQGMRLAEPGRVDEAIRVYDAVIAHFGSATRRTSRLNSRGPSSTRLTR